MKTEIQSSCKRGAFSLLSRGQGGLDLQVARLPVDAVRLSFEADPCGFLARYLADEERQLFSGFRFPRRRYPWLAGRVAAKRLCRRLFKAEGREVLPSEVIIRQLQTGPFRGRPEVSLPGYGVCDISISHSGPWAVCALTPKGRIGIDLETLEPPSSSFIRTVYTPEELELLTASFHELPPPRLAKLLWVMKESLLKAMGVGFYYGLGSLRLAEVTKEGPVFTSSGSLPVIGNLEMRYGFFDNAVFCVSIISD